MGQCSGLFADCTGQNSENPVRKIDQDSMRAALQSNKEAAAHGNAYIDRTNDGGSAGLNSGTAMGGGGEN